MNYANIYKSFILSRRDKQPKGYCEIHHILPRCLGGSDDKDNLIKLTAREHFFAHLLLAKIHGGLMWHALNMMRGRVVNLKSREYHFLRSNFANAHSEYMRSRYKDDLTPWNKGSNASKEYRKKLSLAHKGKVLSDEHRAKVLAALKRRKRDDDWHANISKGLMGHSVKQSTRDKISASLKGNVPHNKGVSDKIVKCPHCGKTGGRSIMKRWHFERCKNKLAI